MADVLLTSPGAITLTDEDLTLGTGQLQPERDAILLECCDLPDKQLTLSEADLDGIVSRFTSPKPVKVEHVDSPLDPLGSVQRVWRSGRQLMGRLAFPINMAAFLRERGTVRLSCGLDRAPLSLAEVSLVLKPRVQAAVLLSDDDAAELARLRIDNARILAENTTQRVDAQIVTLKLAGKIIPATEKAARVLLSAPPSALITLADGTAQDAAGAFLAFLEASPALVTLAEIVPDATVQSGLMGSATGDGGDDITLDMDQREFLARSLGVNPDHVAETIKQDRKKAVATGHTHGAVGNGHHGTSPMGSHPMEGHRV